MGNFYRKILRDIFEICFACFAVLFMIEIYYSGFVNNYFNLNYILGILVILAVLTSFFSPEKEEGGFNLFSLIISSLLFLAFAVVIFLELKSIGVLYAGIITLVSCIIFKKIFNLLRN